VLGDEIVERGEEAAVDSVGPDDKRSGGSRDVLLGDIDGDVPGVRGGMTGGNDQLLRGIGGICGAKGTRLTRDAGIDLAVGRAHGELKDLALGDTGLLHDRLRRAIVGRADDEVSVGAGRRDGAVGQFGRRHVAGRVRVAGRQR
jgi:hypothetical protein